MAIEIEVQPTPFGRVERRLDGKRVVNYEKIDKVGMIEFDDPPAKFVISPNTPVRQIWVSAHSRSFKLDWDPARGLFAMPVTGQTLKELIEEHIEQQIGAKISL